MTAKACKRGYKNVAGRCVKKGRGLIVNIYKNPLLKGTSLGGVSEFHDEALLLMDEPTAQVFEESDRRPTLKVVRCVVFGKEYVHAEPVEPGGDRYAAGGSYIASGDSRFHRYVNRYPIALHDRDMSREK